MHFIESLDDSIMVLDICNNTQERMPYCHTRPSRSSNSSTHSNNIIA